MSERKCHEMGSEVQHGSQMWRALYAIIRTFSFTLRKDEKLLEDFKQRNDITSLLFLKHYSGC